MSQTEQKSETVETEMACFECAGKKLVKTPPGRHFYLDHCPRCEKETAFIVLERLP